MSERSAGTSRRDVLKAGGVVAAGAATFFAGTAAVAQSAEAAVDPRVAGHVPTSIVMEVGGVRVRKVRTASNASKSVSVESSKSPAGTTVFTRGESQAVTVSVTRDLDGDPTFRTWFEGKVSAPGQLTQAIQQTVVLTLLGRNKSTIGTLTLTNAWPSRWGTGTWTVPSIKSVQQTEKITIVADSATFH
jgi:hypothetical protein